MFPLPLFRRTDRTATTTAATAAHARARASRIRSAEASRKCYEVDPKSLHSCFILGGTWYASCALTSFLISTIPIQVHRPFGSVCQRRRHYCRHVRNLRHRVYRYVLAVRKTNFARPCPPPCMLRSRRLASDSSGKTGCSACPNERRI